jgi:hypothetical protein
MSIDIDIYGYEVVKIEWYGSWVVKTNYARTIHDHPIEGHGNTLEEAFADLRENLP